MAVCHTLRLGGHYTTHPRSQVIATAINPKRLTYQQHRWGWGSFLANFLDSVFLENFLQSGGADF